MNVYSISYDLKTPGRDYTGLYEAIKQIGDWWHYLDSTWLVYSQANAEAIFKHLSPHIDKNDFVLITVIGKDYNGWLPQEAWDWIKQRTEYGLF